MVGIYYFFEKHGSYYFAFIHCRLDSDSVMQRKIMNCMAIFRSPISGILAVYIRIECKPSFIQDNIHFRSRKPSDKDT